MKNVTDEAILSSQPDGTDDYTIDVDATLDRLRGGWLIPRGRCAHADGHCYSVFYTAHCLKVYIESPSADRDRVETYERIQDMHDKVPKDVVRAICNNVLSEYARRALALAPFDRMLAEQNWVSILGFSGAHAILSGNVVVGVDVDAALSSMLNSPETTTRLQRALGRPGRSATTSAP
jgi:hypothetical protein